MKRIRRGFFGALIVMLACAAPALAQYISIPDYVGVQAGKAFRTDINNHLSGVTPIAPRLVSLSYSSLPAEADGQLYYCSNCAQTTPCTGGGSGAIAIGQQGQWACNASAAQSIVPPAGDIGGTISSPTVRAAHWTVQTCSTSPCTVTAPVVNCNAASSAIVLDLPAATGSGVPEIVQKIDSSSNGCTLTPAGSDKIDGLSSDSLTVQYQTAHLVDAASGEWNFARAAFSDLLGTISPSQIPASGVTAGSYTNSNITVGADGRVTAASNGTGGGGSSSTTITVANAATTGTTLNALAKFTGAPSTAVITATTDTGGAIGIVTAGAGTSGSATVQTAGLVDCIFDGATTAGDYITISSVTGGDCEDAGASYPNTGEVIGRVLSTNGAAGTYQIDEFPPEMRGASASVSGTYIVGYSEPVNVNTGSATSITAPVISGLTNGDMIAACGVIDGGSVSSLPSITGFSAIGTGASGSLVYAQLFDTIANNESGNWTMSWTGGGYGWVEFVGIHGLSSPSVDTTVTNYATGSSQNIKVYSANTSSSTSNDIYFACANLNSGVPMAGHLTNVNTFFTSNMGADSSGAAANSFFAIGRGVNGNLSGVGLPLLQIYTGASAAWAAGIAAVETYVQPSNAGGSNITGITASYGTLGGGSAGTVPISTYPPTPISLGPTYTAYCGSTGVGPGCKNISVAASGSVTLFSYSGGPGDIREIYLDFQNTDLTGLMASTLTITRDGEGTPSINQIPLADIFLARNSAPQFPSSTLQGGGDFLEGGYNSSNNDITGDFTPPFPIPWTSSISVVLNNGSTTTAGTVWDNLYFQEQPSGGAPNWGNYAHLHATSYANSAIAGYTTVTLMDATDPGANLTLMGLEGTWVGTTDYTYLEGHVKMYSNGSATAFSDTEATEDFCKSNGYFGKGTVLSRDFGDPYLASPGTADCYRFFENDPPVASNELKVTWDNGLSPYGSQTTGLNAVLWWYSSN